MGKRKKLKTQYKLSKSLARIKKNDPIVLQQLYMDGYAKVKRYIIKNTGNEQQAKAVYQEAFLTMWRNVKDDKFTADGGIPINAYLSLLVKNKWSRYLHYLRYKNTIFINREIENSKIERKENQIKRIRIDGLISSLKNLDERCQMVLRMFYFERKNSLEIAALLEIDEISISKIKYECIDRMKQIAKENLDESKN